MSAAKKTQKQAAKKAVKKAAAKPAAAKRTVAESGAKQQPAAKKTAAKKTAAKKTTAQKSAAKKTAAKPAAKRTAKKTAAKRAPAKAPAPTEPARPVRSEDEQAELRAALKERLDELIEEQERFVESIATAQRERLSDTAGDDQIDSGSKTVEHEHEVAVAGAISERIRQVSHALDRLDEGDYGVCEKCGKAIPAARLAAFPSATLCVSCKQLEERR